MRDPSTWAQVLSASLLIATTCPVARSEPTRLEFLSGVESPEDLLQLPGTSWIVVSAMRSTRRPGSLWVVDARQPDRFHPLFPARRKIPAAPAAELFAPHGIAARSLPDNRIELLVVDHGGGEYIDRFLLRRNDREPPTPERVTRIALPAGTSANGVAVLPNGDLIITSMFDPADRAFVDKFARAEATGGVWRWSRHRGWRMLTELQLSGANGIAVSHDGKFAFASEWAARRIWRIPIEAGQPVSIETHFLPDNLRWTNSGALLVAGQTADPRTLFTCVPGRATCPMGYVVASLDPTTLALTPLLHGDDTSFAETHFGAATGAIQVGNSLWLGTFFGDRIARFDLSRPDPATKQ